MTDQATSEELSEIRKPALCGDHGFVAFLLRRDLGYDTNGSIDTAIWLALHPDNFSAWIAINSHVPPSVSFDELINGQIIIGDSLIDIRAFDEPFKEWVFFRKIRNSSVSETYSLGSAEARARAFWEDNGWDILYPILHA